MTLEKLLAQNRIIFHDGATGTLLQQLGLPLYQAPESWVLENPSAVFAAAEAYVNAGAQMILTCTFGGTPFRLRDAGLELKAYEINSRAAQLAKEAAKGRALVLGSIGPLGRLQLTLGGLSYADAVDQFAAQAQALLLGGVDLFRSAICRKSKPRLKACVRSVICQSLRQCRSTQKARRSPASRRRWRQKSWRG